MLDERPGTERKEVLKYGFSNAEIELALGVGVVNNSLNFDSFNLKTPESFDDFKRRLASTDTPRNRLLHRIQTPDRAIYWILSRGR